MPTKPDIPIPFVQAKYCNRTGVRSIDLVVIHTMEHPEIPNTAIGVAKWFAGSSSPIASAHYCVDNAVVVQCVKEGDVAYGAPGTNHNGVHIEHAGYASQTDAQWDDTYSSSMLKISARLAAGICKRWNIPLEFVDAEGLLNGDRGITTHAEVSMACDIAQASHLKDSVFFNKKADKPLTDHTDPGSHFPLQDYLDLIASYR